MEYKHLYTIIPVCLTRSLCTSCIILRLFISILLASRESPFSARQLIIARLGSLTSVNNSEVCVYVYSIDTIYGEYSIYVYRNLFVPTVIIVVCIQICTYVCMYKHRYYILCTGTEIIRSIYGISTFCITQFSKNICTYMLKLNICIYTYVYTCINYVLTYVYFIYVAT